MSLVVNIGGGFFNLKVGGASLLAKCCPIQSFGSHKPLSGIRFDSDASHREVEWLYNTVQIV